MFMASKMGIKYKVEYISLSIFNFKTKKMEFGKEMTAEIMLSDL
jgi:hypothetical protein